MYDAKFCAFRSMLTPLNNEWLGKEEAEWPKAEAPSASSSGIVSVPLN